MKWYAIPSYTMKCRLYLNKGQEEIFEKVLSGLRVAYNATLYDMKMNFGCTKEKKSKDNTVAHFPDFKYAASAEHLNKLRTENPKIGYVKSYSLSGNNGIIQSDLKRMFSKIRENKTGNFTTGKTMPLEMIDYKELNFISKKHPRRSMSFQVRARKVFFKRYC